MSSEPKTKPPMSESSYEFLDKESGDESFKVTTKVKAKVLVDTDNEELSKTELEEINLESGPEEQNGGNFMQLDDNL